MKSLIFLFSLLSFSPLVYGQNKPIQKDEMLFEKGLLLQQLVGEDLKLDNIINSTDSFKSKQELAGDIKETILYKALEFYQELIDSFPKSKLFFRSLNNKGFIELAMDDKKEAQKTFQEILDSKADDKEKGGIGSGLMAEPYANYKNRAAKTLANICIKDSNYTEAIKYLDLTKKYPYRHFCGNEYAAEKIYMSELYAKSYLGLNNKKKALEILLPNIVENGLADNSDLVDLTYITLLKDYKKEELKAKYEEAVKNYQKEKIKSKNGDREKYFIVFLETQIELDAWQLYFPRPGTKSPGIEELYKKTKFYRLLSE